jgi:hypothetical protein
VPSRWHLLLVAGVWCAVAALALTWRPLPALAQHHTCSAGCKAAYGSCYKSSQDRAKCQAQLQRCLEACIRSKR